MLPNNPPQPQKTNQANQLIKLVQTKVTLFHDETGEPYGEYPINSHTEFIHLRSRRFREWMATQFYTYYRKAPGNGAIETALSVLAGMATEQQERKVYLRLGHCAGNIYVDLCNEKWQVVEITPTGWSVLDKSPIPFKRKRGMQALPQPVQGGDLEQLSQFIKTDNMDDWYLLVSWLLASFSQGPYPVLVMIGEQGTGKSTKTKMLKSLIDPNEGAIKAKPRDEEDLMVAANSSWALAYDNVSSISDWLSDAFCRLSTGGAWGKRELYSDGDEIIINAKRPMILNGISDIVNRGDLQSRAIIVGLPVINEWDRKPEKQFWAEFEAAKPAILGALFDVLVTTLSNLPKVKLDRPPRMADFAEWMTAAEPGLCWPEGTFMNAYKANIEGAVTTVLEDSTVANEVMDLVKTKNWEGTATELHSAILSKNLGMTNPQLDLIVKMTPRKLADELRRMAPAMRSFRIDVIFHPLTKKRGKPERLITINNLNLSQSSAGGRP